MRRLKHHLEFILVAGLDFFFQRFPFRMAFTWGEQLGLMMSKVLRQRQQLILSNLASAFPEKPIEEREQIAQAVWENLGRTAAEFLRLPEIISHPQTFPIVWEGAEHIEKALREKSGVILLAAHFSNWEVLGALILARFGHFTAIARPMKNPFVEKWLQTKRGSGGMQVILHRQAVRASLKWVKGNNIIGILVDQNLYTGGEFVDFFGRPAATTTLPALLHARTNAPVIITYSLREGDGFRAFFTAPISPPKAVDGVDAIKAHTQEISNQLEAIIRRTPENWFWIHNRWKRKEETAK